LEFCLGEKRSREPQDHHQSEEEDVGVKVAPNETSKGKGGGKKVVKKKKDEERQQPSPSVEAPRASLPEGQLADLLFIFDARCKDMTNAFPSFGLLNFYSQGITHVWRMVARKLQTLKMVLSTTVMMRYITGCFSASRAGVTFN